MNHSEKSKAISKLTSKWNLKVKDYMHKSSSKIVNCCIENNVGIMVIGKNKWLKRNCNLSSIINQNFVQITFN